MAYSATRQDWVTLDDYVAVVGDLDDDTRRIVGPWLSAYSGELEAMAARPLAVVVADETCQVLSTGLVVTRHRPVTAVGSVRIIGLNNPTTDLSSGNIRIIDPVPPIWQTPTSAVVSYTARFDEATIAAARNIVIERVRRRMVKEIDDTVGAENTSEEGYSANYMPEGWTEGERLVIEGLRRRVNA